MSDDTTIRVTFEEMVMVATVTILKKLWPYDDNFSVSLPIRDEAEGQAASIIMERKHGVSGVQYLVTAGDGHEKVDGGELLRFSVLRGVTKFSGITRGYPIFHLPFMALDKVDVDFMGRVVKVLGKESGLLVTENLLPEGLLDQWVEKHSFNKTKEGK